MYFGSYIEASQQLLNDFNFIQDFCGKCSKYKDCDDVCSPDEESCIRHELFEKACDIIDDANCKIQTLLMNNEEAI